MNHKKELLRSLWVNPRSNLAAEASAPPTGTACAGWKRRTAPPKPAKPDCRGLGATPLNRLGYSRVLQSALGFRVLNRVIARGVPCSAGLQRCVLALQGFSTPCCAVPCPGPEISVICDLRRTGSLFQPKLLTIINV